MVVYVIQKSIWSKGKQNKQKWKKKENRVPVP